MPPEHEEEFPRLSSDELTDLKKWVLGGAPGFAGPTAGDEPDEAFAPRAVAVKEIFRKKCHECHRTGNVANGIKILNHDLLVVKRKVVVPGRPEQSPLFQALHSADKKKVMPPPDQPPLAATEIDTIRLWIGEGAPPFPRARAPAPKR
jgi:hypothetical protein